MLDDFVERLHRGENANTDAVLKERPELASAVNWLLVLDLFAPSREEHATLSLSQRADQMADEARLLDQAASSAAPLSPGFLASAASLREFGDYELEQIIGRGGMGVVFKARQKSLDRPVALKMILASHLASAEQVARFDAEARAAAKLLHPNVVRIYDAGQRGGQHYLAMEYVEGPNLADRLAKDPPTIEESCRLVAQVARAVDHLHRTGIVHRDLKPSNILLDADGQPHVGDFGLAKTLFSENQLTCTGVIAGTPSYMSPEQAAGRNEEVGPHSDVYSLGAILYELLTGRPPFREENPLDTIVQVLEGEPTLPRHLNRGISRELELICLKCLEKSTAARYQSAAALADDLERILKGEAPEIRSPRLDQRLWRWARREPALASRLVVLALFYLVELVNAGREYVPIAFHRNVEQILAAWAISSIIFQQFLKTERWANAAKFCWGATDMVLFTLVLREADGAASPLVVGYPLLIVGAGLWFRVRLVWFMTALSIISYVGVVLEFYILRPELRERFDTAYDRPVFFVIMLLALGSAVAYQVYRVRALSRYYEKRQLP